MKSPGQRGPGRSCHLEVPVLSPKAQRESNRVLVHSRIDARRRRRLRQAAHDVGAQSANDDRSNRPDHPQAPDAPACLS
jgi:hypothetical protein